MITANRYHDFSAGHRVYGHEGHCAVAHGHNYRIHFTCVALRQTGVDDLGRVVDFSVIKATLCQWLENNWDHKFLLSDKDPWLRKMDEAGIAGILAVPFNPTAENMAKYLVEEVAPKILPANVELVECTVEETRKCSATYRKRAY